MSKPQFSSRLLNLPPYIFEKLEKMKSEYIKSNSNVIDFGVGDPDFPTQSSIVNAMKKHLDKPENHHYPSFQGEIELREQISLWYKKNYGVELDPESEVMILLGSKEGIAHLPMALLNEGDYALVPDPGYPAYLTSIILAGGNPHLMPLKRENNYFPMIEDIPADIARKSKLMFLNYPNNPTSAIAEKESYSSIIKFAEKNNIVVAQDFAYSELTFDGRKAISFLSVEGSKNVGVEFHSFSKMFAMTGWRLGFVVGNKEILKALGKLKSCIDSGVFKAIQYAGIEAMTGSMDNLEMMKKEYSLRRDILAKGLEKLGWDFDLPSATYYFWVRIPNKYKMNSIEFSEYLLKEKGLIVTPGCGFGEMGEGHIRIAINLPVCQIEEAIRRLETL